MSSSLKPSKHLSSQNYMNLCQPISTYYNKITCTDENTILYNIRSLLFEVWWRLSSMMSFKTLEKGTKVICGCLKIGDPIAIIEN